MRDTPEVLIGNGSVAARDIGGAGDVERFAPGRRCAAEGCRTILSSYNAGDRCWAHREATPVLSLGMRRTRAEEGPRVLTDKEERALIEALTAHRGTIRPRRHPEPAPEPAPAPTPPPPSPVPAPDTRRYRRGR
jgi:hypothetical protein